MHGIENQGKNRREMCTTAVFIVAITRPAELNSLSSCEIVLAQHDILGCLNWIEATMYVVILISTIIEILWFI